MTAVSVVIPTRDRRELLRTTLRSALEQRGVDHEIVVVDDGSSESGSVPRDQLDDPRVHTVRFERSRGVAAARNAGIERARGTWVAFLDDDDLWAPDKLAAQLRAAVESRRDWAYTSAVYFLDERPPRPWFVADAASPDALARVLPFRNVVPAGSSNVIVRRSLLEETGGFDEELSQLADWDMWLRLLRAGPPAVVPRHLVAYRLHASNWLMRTLSGIDEDLRLIEERHAALRGGQPLDRWPFRRWVGVALWRAGRFADARRVYFSAVRDGHSEAIVPLLRSLIPIQRLRPGSTPPWPPATGWVLERLGSARPDPA